MDKLLDKDVHQLSKVPSLSSYLSGQSSAAASAGAVASTHHLSLPAPGTSGGMLAPTQPPTLHTGAMEIQQQQQAQQQHDIMQQQTAAVAGQRGMMMGGSGGRGGGRILREEESDESLRDDGTPRSSSSTLVSLAEIQVLQPTSSMSNVLR